MSNQIAQINMVKQQLRTGNVLDKRVLELYDTIPRDSFVPAKLKAFAYADMHLPLNHDECMMTPLEEALLLQALDLKGHETVLEIGTGTGFLTALLSRLCKKITSVDYYADFTANARQNLIENKCLNVELFTGDAIQGWTDSAPYDVIVFTGALESLSEIQRLQLLPGGKLFAIMGKKPIMQGKLYSLDHAEVWSEQVIFETCLPALIDKSKSAIFDF